MLAHCSIESCVWSPRQQDSMFASSKIIAGDLPPSSSRTFFKLDLAAAVWIKRPVRVDPVNVRARTSI